MPPADPQISLQHVLQTFHQDQLYLFLAAGITTVALLAAAFSLLQRRFDPLLLWFALFALFYGVRLWLTHQMLALPGQETPALDLAIAIITFLIPIPAFLFVRHLGLAAPFIRPVTATITPFAILLTLVAIALGPRPILFLINNIVIAVALVLLVIPLVRNRQPSSETDLLRRGLFVFTVCALFDNLASLLGLRNNVETFSFIVLLICLGIVAGRRTLLQQQQLTTINKELEIAQRIQRSILPSTFPNSASFQVGARYVPMTAVAGDFYDFLLADDQQAGILIADVSGHGVPAALIASMVKLAATSQREHANQPAELLLGMNATLSGNTQSQFVTAAYVYLNATTQKLLYAAAAHPAMLLLRAGEVTAIMENGLMLAAFPFATYTATTHTLRPGDRLLLYTDGILEAESAAAEEFGPDRLRTLLLQTSDLTPVATADRIISAVQAWSVSQNDDLTVLVCDYRADPVSR